MHVQPPKWRWEWNINTVAVLIGFAGGLVAWGYNYAELQGVQERNARNIEQMREEMSDLTQANRTLDNHELRLAIVERQATDANDAMRTLEQTIASLSADVRVTREILERLERGLNGSGPTRSNFSTALSE